jgi:membrane carboxypeptidase/penicillin-binding protein PbpC
MVWKNKLEKKYFIFWILIFLAVSFLSYCFFPIVTHDYEENKPQRIYLTDRNWIIITDKPNEFWYKKETEIALNNEFIKALIQIEDKNYYSHFWVNILSKFRAFLWNIKASKITSGWSTITEQYVKNEFFWNSKRTYLQKGREAVISFFFSLFYDKNEILNNYLQNAYFWNNVYWLLTATEVFFSKTDLNELTQEEITLLIALLHTPSANLESENFGKYFNQVKERLDYDFDRTIFSLPKPPNIDKFPFVTSEKIVTIDSNFQFFAENVLNQTLKELKSKNVTNWAIFAINPKTNEVLLYVWSKDFNAKDIDWQVNVLKSFRQPWSTMKPFLYLLALEKWAGVNDFLIDIENQYNSFQEDKVYISENYTLKEYWLVRLKKALWNSLNNASVRLARELWLQKVYDFYKSYGFDLPEIPEYYGYSLVLGNPSITLIDLVYSYSKLLDFSDPNKFLLYQILSNPDNRDISFWVNSILNTSIPQAVKTWTSSNFRDNLVISYHPDFVLWVWVGNNDNSSMTWVTGITWAGYIWHQIIEEATKLWYIKPHPNSILLIGEGIDQKSYCLDVNCFRKELDFDKTEREYFSRIVSWIYDERDVFGSLSGEEKEYLKVLGFELK